MNIDNNLLTDEIDLRTKYRVCNSEYEKKTVKFDEVDVYLGRGWEEKLNAKNKVIKNKASQPLQKKLSHDIIFENKVWCILYRMGFNKLNRDRKFILQNKDKTISHQIDVFAADDETLLCIECKSTKTLGKKNDFSKDIHKMKACIDEFTKSLVNFDGIKRKVKFIFSTNNYALSNSNYELLNTYKIEHFSQERWNYYEQLSNHIGHSSRYQMLGHLFKGVKIKNLDEKVNALKCKMGGIEYYTFSIKPANLLKFCYIAHRHDSIDNIDPNYQRLIKKSRLKSVQSFIDEGGFFPNSIIININSRSLKFETFTGSIKEGLTQAGSLELPKNYGSATIIDGQHRVYGYSDTEKAEKDAIPVVAFHNLDADKQLQFFVDINTNQKNVDVNLMNDLKELLYTDTKNLINKTEYMAMKTTRHLARSFCSPLYDMIHIGENKPTSELALIKSEAIKKGIIDSKFYGKPSKTEFEEVGLFYSSNYEKMQLRCQEFITCCLDDTKNNMIKEWNLGDKKNGYILTNDRITGFILLYSDILNFIVKQKDISITNKDENELLSLIKPYLKIIYRELTNLELDEKIRIKKTRGTAGITEFRRLCQEFIHNEHPKFQPEGFLKWQLEKPRPVSSIRDNISEVEHILKIKTQEVLVFFYGNLKEAEFRGIPAKTLSKAREELDKKVRKAIKEGKNKKLTLWDDGFDFGDLEDMIKYRDNNLKNNEFKLQDFITPDFEDTPQQYLDFLRDDIRNEHSHKFITYLSAAEEQRFNKIYEWFKEVLEKRTIESYIEEIKIDK